MKRKYILQDNEPGAAGGGDAAPAAAAAPAADATPAAPAPASTVLQSAKPADAAPAPAADAPKPISERIPEKFRVTKEDGSLDLEASLTKVEEHRSHLEKRMGAGDLPPKSADDYKVNVPEKLAESFKAEELAADPLLKAFMADAHANGMTQKQVDMVIGQYLERLPQVAGAYEQLNSEACTTALREAWKSEAEFNANTKAAFNAAKAYAGQDLDGILKDYGNDPRIIKLLSNVGKELGEDRGAAAGAQGVTSEDIQSMTKTPAYWDKSHPEHEKTVAKVQQFYERTYGNKPKSTGGMFVGTL